MSSRLRRSTRFALTPAERALIDDNKHTSTGKKDNKREILKRGGSADSKSSKKGKPEKEKEKDKEKEKVEKMREKKNPKRNSESALPDGSGAGTAEPPKKTRKSADSSLSPVTQNRKREGQTTSAPSIEPQPPAENSVTLPSIYDEAAIDAFFKKNKKRTFRDLLGESLERDQDSHLIAGAQQLLKDPSSASTSDAIKQIIGAGSREMSVKEALALNFRNYRVRMPKQRYDALVSGNIISAAMFEPNYGRDDPSLISPSGVHTPQQRMNLQEMITVMQEMGANPANPLNLDANEEGNETSFNLEEFLKSVPFPGKSSKTIAELLIEMNFREDTFEQSSAAPVTVQEQTPSYLVSNGHKGYPFFPFWKLPTNVSRGYRNVYYVQGIKYVLLNTIMYQDAIIVPMNEPISFRFNDYLFDMSLNDLLIANGILIHDHTSCRDMLAFLNSCGFAIHHDLSEYLMGTYGPNISGNAANSKKDLLPISLTPEFPPFVAHKLDYFVLGFGRRYGINEIVDVTQTLSRAPLSHFSSAPAARVQPPRNPVSAPVQASDSSVPETSIDNEEEGVKNLRRNTVICAALSSGQKADIVAERFGITSDEVIEIGKTREEVARQFTEHYTSLLAERDSSMRAHDLNCSDLVMSHKKRTGKVGIRRTNYVGLNVMMWRFFKDCKDNGICLNGKLLKEQAMLYAKQLGLENFKGSEGWLDAFKRRHKIDLKAMSGVPVNYEDDVSTKMEYDEENEANRPSSASGDSNTEISLDQIKAAGEGLTAALLDCVEKASSTTNTPTAMANISSSKPLDLAQFFNDMLEASTSGNSSMTNPEVTSSAIGIQPTALQAASTLSSIVTTACVPPTPITTHTIPTYGRGGKLQSNTTVDYATLPRQIYQQQFGAQSQTIQTQPAPAISVSQPQEMIAPQTSTSVNTSLDEKSLIASVVKSAAIVVPDRDVSFALDTLRSFILKNDPTLMPMMLDLQLKIASLEKVDAQREDGGWRHGERKLKRVLKKQKD